MAEEWRVTIALDDARGADGSADGAANMTSREMRRRDRAREGRTRDLAREMRNRLSGAVIEPDVPSGPRFELLERLGAWRGSADGSPVRVYVDSREAAEAAARVAWEVAGQRGLSADVSVECWHPLENVWADAATASRHDLAEEARIQREYQQREHDYQQREERRRSAETGVAQWQVQVKLRTHRDTVALAKRLSADGQPLVRRWKSLVAGANCEDDAHRLAETIRQYTAADAAVHVERTIPTPGFPATSP